MCSWAMPATRSRSVNSVHRLAPSQTSRTRAGRPVRHSSGAARWWSARRCRPACRPSGRRRPGREARPCTSSSVLASRAALTGASASPKPNPPSTRARGDRLSSEVSPQRDISTNPPPPAAIPAAVTTPAGTLRSGSRRRPRRPAARPGSAPAPARPQLDVGVDRGAGEERDVDQGRDQRGADEEADQHRAPGRRTPQRAGRHQGAVGPAQVDRRTRPRRPTAPSRYHGPGRRRPGPWGRRWRTPGSRRPARPRAAAPRAGRPRAAPRIQPRRSTSGRRRRTQRTTEAAASAPIAVEPSGVSQRPSPANGMNSWPQVRSRSSSGGLHEDEHAGDQRDEQEQADRPEATVSRLRARASAVGDRAARSQPPAPGRRRG